MLGKRRKVMSITGGSLWCTCKLCIRGGLIREANKAIMSI